MCRASPSPQDTFPEGHLDWHITMGFAMLSFWMLRFLVLGSRINAKYSDTSVLLTEQINLQLRMLDADSSEKMDRLKVTSNVLKVRGEGVGAGPCPGAIPSHRAVLENPRGGGRARSLYATPPSPPPPPPPPPRVLKDSWGVGRIRTGCSRPPV